MDPNKPMYETVGQYLKKHREQQALSLAAVAEETHIRLQYLRAIEEDDRAQLPSAVQARGFLRLYAGVLKLDVRSVLDAWDGKPIEEFLETSGEPLKERHETETSTNTDADNDTQPEQQDQDRPDANPTDDFILDSTAETQAETPVSSPEPTDNINHDRAVDKPTSKTLYAEISRRLKEQRKLMNLSLQDVENITHIRVQNLTAIEASHFADLPAGVQARGMLKSYAEFLTLNADEILAIYAEALQIGLEERNQINSPPRKQKSQAKAKDKTANPRQILSTDLIIGTLLILVVITVAVLSVSKVISTNRTEISSREAITQTNIAALSATPSLTISPTATATSIPTSDIGEFLISSTQSDPIEPQTTPENANARVQVYIVANQRAYLRITADEQVVFDGRVVPGNAYQFYAENQIDLLCGNASAISLLLIQDQQETNLGTLGNVGEVVNMSYRPDVIITPTALPSQTPTITNTPRATNTPEMDAMVPSPTP
jgi:cytoskeletal protein RodZ